MFRQASASVGALSLRAYELPFLHVRWASWKSQRADENLEAEYSHAREWASGLKTSTIPRSVSRIRFDRASGKGGQHVNTTSSKATCTWDMRSIKDHVPDILLPEMRKSRYYAPSSDTLVISAQTSRKQHENEDECYKKFHQLLRDVCKKVIPGETSKEQKVKVEQMKHAENAARLKIKKQQSSKKKSRNSAKGGGGPDY